MELVKEKLRSKYYFVGASCCSEQYNCMQQSKLHTCTYLKHFVGDVDKQLLEGVVLEDFKAEDVKKP